MRFRVRCSPVDYYNYDFSDDREWRAFRLESPDLEHVLYGYVPRYSDMELRLDPPGDGDETLAFVLSLKYPEGAGQENQVLIGKVEASGWVLAVETSSPE